MICCWPVHCSLSCANLFAPLSFEGILSSHNFMMDKERFTKTVAELEPTTLYAILVQKINTSW
jgi:hypothetical protein